MILKKYSPIGELGQVAESFAESVSSTLGLPVMVSDTDRYVAVSGMKNRDYINRNIDEELDDIIQHKSEYNTDSKVIVPILLNGDPIGSVTILPSDGEHLTDLELKTARLGAGFLGKQMES